MMNINLLPALPEIFIVAMIILMLLVDAFVGETKKTVNTVLTVITLIVAYIIQILVYNGTPTLTFNNMFILDNIAQSSKLLTYIFSLIIVIYSRQYINDKKLLKGEFYAVFLFAVLGMLVMISSINLLTLYVGLELLSLSLYGLIALDRDNIKATESAMKFFILGALASGILLYGISFIYGATGGMLQLDQVAVALQSPIAVDNNAILVFGLVFIVAGLLFKLGIVPFHMWVPDVYEGSSLAVTTVIGSIVKLAGLIFVIRFLYFGLLQLHSDWSVMLAIGGFLSLFVGNIVAIAQTNIKRMLGYSTVANMGFIAFGLMTTSINGLSACIFYMVTYVITALAGFGVLLLLSKDNYECETIADLRGLNKNHPIYAGIFAVVMFSFAGIPPLVGFYAKFKILEALIEIGYVRTAVFAVVMSLIGAFFYLRVVKVMYFDDGSNELVLSNTSIFGRSVLFLNGLLIILLGILPGGLMLYCSGLLHL